MNYSELNGPPQRQLNSGETSQYSIPPRYKRYNIFITYPRAPPPPKINECAAILKGLLIKPNHQFSRGASFMSRFPSPKWKQNNPLELTQPGRVTFKLLGITYLVGKIKFKLLASGSAGPPGGCYSSRELGDPSKKHQALAGAALLWSSVSCETFVPWYFLHCLELGRDQLRNQTAH